MGINNKLKNILSLLIKLLYYTVISFVCVIVFFLLYYIIVSQINAGNENYKPRVSIYTIVSPSMTPVINVYDVVVNIRADDPTEIEIGDIITFKSSSPTSEGMTITHRVIEVSQLPDGTYEYMTQGDNNSEPDSSYVLFDSIIGKEVLIIPYLGKLQFLIASEKGWLFLLLIPVSIYLIREIFKIIDLFGLRKKVKRIIEQSADSPREDQIIEEKEVERKEKIKEELKNKVIKKDSKVKSDKEPSGFLERYTETTLNIKTNKYNKDEKKSKEEVKTELAADTSVIIPTKVNLDNIIKPEKNEENEIILPKEKNNKKEEFKVIDEHFEILDTDDLTSKIKEYDSKIDELNKMIKELEGNNKPEFDKAKKEKVIEEDNFLKGNKIKVVEVEETKNKKQSKYLPSKEKVEKFEDIETLRREEILKTKTSKEKPIKKEKLNLNPKEIKKINRGYRKKENSTNLKKLNLNPKEVKKVNRTKKKKKSKNSPKKGLIIIEKKK